ncbi:prefoldin subunit [Blastocystis sp. ATCC 50177/Nand II]|uniref:Prefoldin subunit n=1 Tax=Blastocystis sp. subtype 1 (strain ATCC 50177 / NandII) TaxID=478820 RepID=A0A196SB82_BLAHN|nr:prefoldin subunit [Blastocystis sp. ATCC 50177/Nand II]
MAATNIKDLVMTQEEKDRFIRFNSLLEEIKDIDASIDTMKSQIQQLNDANDEGMLAEDEEGNLMLSCGSLFVSMNYTTLESQLTERIEMAEAEIKKLEDERATMKAELEEIKKQLYARFGDLVVLG